MSGTWYVEVARGLRFPLGLSPTPFQRRELDALIVQIATFAIATPVVVAEIGACRKGAGCYVAIIEGHVVESPCDICCHCGDATPYQQPQNDHRSGNSFHWFPYSSQDLRFLPRLFTRSRRHPTRACEVVVHFFRQN